MRKLKVGIIGLGRIGTTLAEELTKSPKDYVIYPFNRSRDKVITLSDDLTYPDYVVIKDRLEELLAETDIAVIAAGGIEQRQGDIDRNSFLKQNAPIISEIGRKFKGYKGNVIVVTNPVDECTFNFWDVSELDSGQIVGLNHTDSIRYKRIVRNMLLKDGKDVPLEHILGCHTIGPHNNKVFPLASMLDICGHNTSIVKEQIKNIRKRIAKYAETQIGGRTSTTWTTVEAICDILKAVSEPEKIVSVSTYYKGIFIGIPGHFVNQRIVPIFDPISELGEEELKCFLEGYADVYSALNKQGIDGRKLQKGKDTIESIEKVLESKRAYAGSKVQVERIYIEKEQKILRELNSYLFIRKIGSGAHGSVYRAINCRDEQVVAIKRSSIKEDIREEKEITEMFSHKNVIAYIDYLENRDEGFLITEYAERNISSISNNTLDEKIGAIFQLFEGLHYIHSKGIVHLDIKPENVLLTDEGTVKLIDFALSQNIKDVSKLDTSRWAINYAAPELLNGKLSPMADIYSAGAIAFELLTGMSYRDSKTRSSQIAISKMKGIGDIILRCLEKDILKRYVTAEGVLSDISEKIKSANIVIPLISLHGNEDDTNTTWVTITGPVTTSQRYFKKLEILHQASRYETKGNMSAALESYRAILGLYPRDELAESRIEEIQKRNQIINRDIK